MKKCPFNLRECMGEDCNLYVNTLKTSDSSGVCVFRGIAILAEIKSLSFSKVQSLNRIADLRASMDLTFHSMNKTLNNINKKLEDRMAKSKDKPKKVVKKVTKKTKSK